MSALPGARSTLGLSILLLFSSSCSGGERLPDVELPLRATRQFPTPAAGLGGPIDLAVSDDRLYVLDLPGSHLHTFTPTGVYESTGWVRGRGPGELLHPTAAGVSGEHLWVLNTGNNRVDYFSRSGEYLATQPLPSSHGPIFHMVEVDGSFFATTLTGESPVVRFSAIPLRDGGTPLSEPIGFGKEFLDAANRIAPRAAGSNVLRLVVIGDRLWLLHAYLPLIGIYTTEGTLQALVQLPSPSKSQERRLARMRAEELAAEPMGTVGAVAIRPDLILLMSQQQDSRGKQRVFLVEQSGTLQGVSLNSLPYHFAFVHSDADGIYAVAKDTHSEEPVLLQLAVSPDSAPL